jgi:hypothetical protein
VRFRGGETIGGTIGSVDVQSRSPERRSEVGNEHIPSEVLQWSSNMCRNENAKVSPCTLCIVVQMVCGAR